MYTDSYSHTELNGGINMATFTISAPKELAELRKRFPGVNWNEVMKSGIIKRLNELNKFEDLKNRSEL